MESHLRKILTGLLFVSLAISASLVPQEVLGAGFEVGENTPEATARGGTGVVNKSDPSAVYFNPALLGRVQNSQILLSSNFLSLDLEFQRDDFYETPGGEPDRTFDPATNQTGVFPAPFITANFDVGPEDFSLGAGIFGPPAYGNPCYGTIEDGECQPDRTGATRGMVVEADLVVAYAGVGGAYGFDLGDDRRFDIGLTAAMAYQNSDFAVVVESDPQVSAPWQENPDREAFVRGRDLSGIAPTGILGLAYSDGPLRLAASYRPPIRWNTTGRAEVDFPEDLQDQQPALSDDTIHLQTWQAGSFRLGWGLQWGEHPGDPQKPRWDLEINTVWENWSLVEDFRFEFDGNIELQRFEDDDGNHPTVDLNPIYQQKGYQDTISIRTGLSYGVNGWLTAHSGAFMETAAQPVAYTSADFISWERYAGSIGASLYLPANLKFDLGYTYIHSPSRTVRNGKVYNPIPMSECRGPDYDAGACQTEGTPPGNPQNEGQWSANFQILSAGMTWQY